MRARGLPLLFAATLVGSGSGVAQSSPRDVAERFIAAWDQRDWNGAARLLDLDLFDKFRQDFVERARRQGDRAPEVSVDDLLRQNPDMPRDVAEYQVRMIRQQRERFADPAPFEFARVRSLDQLEGMSSAEAAARWLESRDPAWQIRMQFEAAGCRPPEDADNVPPVHRRLIGMVDEGDATSYALFREERSGDDRTAAWVGGDIFVMVLHRTGEDWKVVPRSDLLPEVGMVDTRDCR